LREEGEGGCVYIGGEGQREEGKRGGNVLIIEWRLELE